MFYCEECREEREWPKSFMKSHGTCECCGKPSACYDTPSSQLPVPKVEYPECERLADVRDESKEIGAFLEWYMSKKNGALYLYKEEGDNGEPKWLDADSGEPVEYDRTADLNGKIKLNPNYNSWRSDYYMDNTSIENLLAEYFDIDMKKVEEERQAMLNKLRAS